MPLKYAAAGLVALEWQGQRRLLGILVEHWDVIQDETTPQ
jgi:predicted SnoaL-like aldol condensation-catalyzing enzyme